jgi:hypothetical protein
MLVEFEREDYEASQVETCEKSEANKAYQNACRPAG